LRKRLHDLLPSSRESNIRTRHKCGRSGSPARTLLLPAPTRAFDGHITRLNLITAAGTGKMPITITTGTILSMIVSAILAGMIRNSLATISSTALTPLARQSVTTAVVTRSEWRPAQNGSGAATWTRATGHQPDTSNAWNGFWRLIH